MPKRRKSVADSTLSKLWSQAVIAKYGCCPITGARYNLDAHHIVGKGRQNRFPLRWEIRNGLPLRHDIHRAFHDGDPAVAKKIYEHVERRGDLEFLEKRRHLLKKDFLQQIGMSEDEYRRVTKDKLQSIIDAV